MAASNPSPANELIGGRFRRDTRARTVGEGTWWHGVDVENGEQVEILQIPAGRAPAVIDAAVRARAVSHPGLPQVVEIVPGEGKDGDGHVVTTAARGRTLADRMPKPLPPAEARRITADVGAALSAADDAGLHHGRLRPHDVILADDGTVTVTGVALTPELTGMTTDDAYSADLRSLAGVLYAGLTGHWPHTAGAEPDLPKASERGGSPVPPKDVVPGVPDDLDALCASSLAKQPTGATSVPDLTSRLTSAARAKPSDASATTPPDSGPALADTDTTTGDHDDQRDEQTDHHDRVHDAGGAAGTALAGFGAAVTSRWRRLRSRDNGDDQDPEPDDGKAGSIASSSTEVSPAGSGRDPETRPRPASTAVTGRREPQEPDDGKWHRSVAEADTPATATGPGAGGRQAAATPDRDRVQKGERQEAGTPIAAAAAERTTGSTGAGTSGPHAARPAHPTMGSTPLSDQAAPTAGPAASDGMDPESSNSPSARQRATTAVNRAATAAAGSAVATRATQQMRVAGESAQRMMDRLHPEIPHLTPEEKKSRTKTVVGIFSAGIAMALVLSLVAIATLFHSSKGIAEALSSPSPSTTSKLPKKQTNTPVILAATAEDPFGDKREHEDEAPNVIDKDGSTVWNSSQYNSANFGGLKQGIGLMITLRAAAPVSRIVIAQRGQGGTVEIRNAPSGSYEGSSPMITGVAMQSPSTVITLPKKPVAKNVLVWFTGLPRTSEGYQLAISGITVS